MDTNSEQNVHQKFTKEQIFDALNKRHTQKLQDRLNEGHVAIAGLGGLGSNVAISLARIGVGHLHLIDFDQVDLTNLNRQQYFMKQVGQYKTDALKQELLQINPYLDIQTDCIKVTPDCIKDLFATDAIICEAFDMPEAKAMLVSSILEQYPEKIIISGSGMAGYTNSNLIHTRKVTSHFYICGDEVTDLSPDHGLMAPRVALCAAHQANLITELLLQTID